MNAPFCKGDVVVRVKLPAGVDEAPWDPTVIGNIYVIDEVKELELNFWGVRIVGHGYIGQSGQRTMWHQPKAFRLYDPPKAEDRAVKRAMDAIAGRIKNALVERLRNLGRDVE